MEPTDRWTIRALYARVVSGPTYPPDDGDLRDVSVAGLAFPVRASGALLAATILVLLDMLGLAMPQEWAALGGSAEGLRLRAIERALLFGVAPLGIVLLAFRDDPARYGLRLGDWRWGAGLLTAGLVAMTPIILWLSGEPTFRAYYAPAAAPLGDLLFRHLVELVPAEFLLRGFLMFALFRRAGPLAILVVQVPFVFTHVGKPEIELWSTFIGGTVFAWLDWRTGSILWSALGHVYILTLMVVAVGGVA